MGLACAIPVDLLQQMRLGHLSQGKDYFMLKTKRARASRAAMLTATAVVSIAANSLAATHQWSFNGSGNWSTPGNWIGGVPTAGGNVLSTHIDATNRTINYDYTGGAISLNSMAIDNQGAGIELFSQAANNFTAAFSNIGESGKGNWQLSGGTFNLTSGGIGGLWFGVNASGSGSGTLSSLGTVNVPTGGILVGNNGVGTFTQTGGTANVGYLALGYSSGAGTYNFIGGELKQENTAYIGNTGTGNFINAGGTHNIGSIAGIGALIVGNNSGAVGTYSMNGGSYGYLFTNGNSNETIGFNGKGTFNQLTGFHQFGNVATTGVFTVGANVGSSGSYLMDGSYFAAYGTMNIGDAGAGTLSASNFSTVNFGHTAAYANIGVGRSAGGTGSLLLNNASSQIFGTLYIGVAGTGTLGLSGNSSMSMGYADNTLVSPASLVIGNDVGSNGTASLNDTSTLSVMGQEYVGGAGNGTFSQTGGTHLVGNAYLGGYLYVGGSGGNGTYSLSGSGRLETSYFELIGGTGNGTFIQTGGSHKIGGPTYGALYVGASGDSTGNYFLSGNSTLTILGEARIGTLGQGTFIQNGGQVVFNTVPSTVSTLIVANGTYQLNAGVLDATVAGEYVGDPGFPGSNGLFAQAGGIHHVGTLNIGSAVSVGTYNLTGGAMTGGTVLLNASGTFNAAAAGVVDSNFFQTGGTVTGTLHNLGTFNYGAGNFAGRLVNQGTVRWDSFGTFTTGDGVENDGQLAVGPGQTLVTNGTGLTNLGTFTLNGGTLRGSTLVNDYGGVFNAVGGGALATLFTNRSQLNVTGGSVLNAQGFNNFGVINLPVGGNLRPLSMFNNSGIIDLSGGALSGGGAVTNSIGGTIRGGGNVAIQINPAGGTVLADDPSLPLSITTAMGANSVISRITVNADCAMNFSSGFANAGIVSLGGGNAILAVSTGSISNTGTIRGAGTLAAPIANTGIIRAENGELDLSGSGITNPVGGQFVTGNQTLLVLQGLTTNAGAISLADGVFDNGNGAAPLTNSGSINGRGTIRSGTLTNSGSITFSDGSSDVYAPITNTGRINAFGNNVTTFFSNVTTTVGTINVAAGSTVVFAGNLTGLSHVIGAGVKNYEASGASGAIASMVGTTNVGGLANVTADSVREDTVNVYGALSLNQNGNATSTIRALSVSNPGAFDLNDNDLIVGNGTSKASVVAMVKNARHSGAWDLSGITSSAAKNRPGAKVTGLGVLSGAQFLSAHPGAGSFSGLPFAPTDTLVKYTWNGDADFNGRLDFDDYSRIDNGFNVQNNPGTIEDWFTGDFDFNSRIDFDDYALIDNAFNAQSGTLARALAYLDGTDRSGDSMGAPSLQLVAEHFEQMGGSYAQSFIAAVPEPTVFAYSLCALSVLVGRRKRAAIAL